MKTEASPALAQRGDARVGVLHRCRHVLRRVGHDGGVVVVQQVLGGDGQRVVPVGAEAVRAAVLAEIEVLVLMAEDRQAEDVALIRQFRQRVASCAKMCCIGVSGIGTPAILPISGPQMPAAETTISVAIRPCGVTTARTRPFATSMPVTGVCVVEGRAPLRCDRRQTAARWPPR